MNCRFFVLWTTEWLSFFALDEQLGQSRMEMRDVGEVGEVACVLAEGH